MISRYKDVYKVDFLVIDNSDYGRRIPAIQWICMNKKFIHSRPYTMVHMSEGESTWTTNIPFL